MATINLLPWREQRREERKKQFLVLLGCMVAFCAVVISIADQVISSEIASQTARNDFIAQQNAQLDVRIKAISDLKARRKQLIARMKIIQDLQGNRPIIGRVFDQLVRTLPDGVYFTEVKMVGQDISVWGAAQTNNRVSELMRNLEASPWFAAPSLAEVKAGSGESEQNNAFQLTVRQTLPQADAEADGQ
ncbi:PilN domain-containing protein [Pseudomonas typographi]|uniref:PilN domain-containing protein n=1 Tax=Pseudomonas typographi TaxID=2715964 RepID=A0ABR7Z5U3_9PSED|nr:PilN domain-containing protein [Pseudomonas typographi]MBD1551835.1 PilN domain-containing protein [Pseudomonas typographi]MBD1587640.1 PilN domain-containing protein [Pseudomonas typographi]MBD1600822.1 PilN domain-containing protein [Pseudomonas typographi]